jgi:hypothetical protein
MTAYKIVVPGLIKTADTVKRHMIDQWGIKPNLIVVEREVILKAARSLRPTFQALGQDHLICVEVSESVYPAQIDQFVGDCHVSGLPVELWVAIPDTQKIEAKHLNRATETGVGILLVGSTCRASKPAVMLSLAGVRDPDSSTYPRALRQAVDRAYSTFMQGDPVKACSAIYDEIEGLTRRIAIKASKMKYWKKGTIVTPPDASNPKQNFKPIAEFLHNHFDAKASKAIGLDGYLLADVVATAGHRNDVSHPPKSADARRQRDQRCRTRFESACDLLRQLSVAAKPLRIV